MSNINVGEYPLLDAEAETEMLIKAQNGDIKARDYMILCNTPLVKSIIKIYAGKGVEADDLFQVGVMGLMRAIKGFEIERGLKFSGYAHRWITNHMQRTIQLQSRAIRVPCHIYQENFNLVVATKILEQELGRRATEKELAEYAGVTIKRIKEYRSTMIDTCSMNEQAPMEGTAEIGDIIADKSDIAGEIAITLTTNQMLETIKEFLTDKEFKIICMKVGLGCKEHTYNEISKEFGVTKQRIQQIYRNCTEKLKRNNRIKLYKVS